MAKECIVCGSSVQQLDFALGVELDEKLEHNLLLEEFCKNPAGDVQEVVDSLKTEWKEELICGKCTNSLKKVMDTKRIVEETEKDVNRLQLELLKKLQMREDAVDAWKRQVAKVEQMLSSAKDDDNQSGNNREHGENKTNPLFVSLNPAVCAKPEMVTGAQVQQPVLSESYDKPEEDLSKRKVKANVETFDQADWQCDVCQKVFQAQRNLARHKKVHTNERPHQCAQCNKAFYRKDYLKKHIRTAHGHEKPFSCDNSKNEFTRKACFLKHQKTHTYIPKVQETPRDKRFQCLFCDSKFFLKNNLAEHLRRHTQERPFFCRICGTSFRYSSNLSKHQRTHQDNLIKRFGCVFCEARFSNKPKLDGHVLTHIQEKPYSCSTCVLSFSHVSSLRRHAKSMHHNDARI